MGKQGVHEMDIARWGLNVKLPRQISSMAMADIEEEFYSCALIHLGNISYRVGRTLKFDPDSMKFINDEEANKMLTREYRAPFTVPEKV